MQNSSWLLFLYTLGAGDSRQRVNLWRKLKKFGAVPFKTSASLLPDQPRNHEKLQWLAQQVRDEGGDATLIRANTIEGWTYEQLTDLFNRVRSDEYEEVRKRLRQIAGSKRKHRSEADQDELKRAQARLTELQEIDFFHAPLGIEVRQLLQKILSSHSKHDVPAARLKRADFLGRTWLTRPRPEIDRVASAWLIKRFVDPKALFVFATDTSSHSAAIPYDMAEAEFTHHGDDCTFETLMKRFQIRDKGVLRLAELVHDTDLEDEKFRTHGGEGLHTMFQGLARLGWTDEQILEHGFKCFDALLAQLKDK
ncbi:MAG TPA: chromate resistance protein ChrB domain-containing protein [Opitutaceae bacterium]